MRRTLTYFVDPNSEGLERAISIQIAHHFSEGCLFLSSDTEDRCFYGGFCLVEQTQKIEEADVILTARLDYVRRLLRNRKIKNLGGILIIPPNQVELERARSFCYKHDPHVAVTIVGSGDTLCTWGRFREILRSIVSRK